MKQEDFNGYNFDKEDTQKRIKYVVIFEGDYDINGAYGIESKEELLSYLKNDYKEIQAIIKVEKFINFKKTTEQIVKIDFDDAQGKTGEEDSK